MALEFEGSLVKVLSEVTGQSKNGAWVKQDFVLETEDQYPKKACFTAWGEKAADLKTFSLGGNASYGLQSTTLGGVQNNFAIGLNASKAINERSSISAAASAQVISSTTKNDGSSTISRYSFGPTYSYQLTKDWDFSAGYKFTLRDAAAARAKAHNAFLMLAYKFRTK